MGKLEKFSIIIGPLKQIELGSIIKQGGKTLIVTNIRKVEYITNKLILVSGDAKLKWQTKELL